eukprot:scaffold712_cov69-Cyclotella_meneghiniana.AAC.3
MIGQYIHNDCKGWKAVRLESIERSAKNDIRLTAITAANKMAIAQRDAQKRVNWKCWLGGSKYSSNTVDVPQFGHQRQFGKRGYWPGVSGVIDAPQLGHQRQLEKGGHWPGIIRCDGVSIAQSSTAVRERRPPAGNYQA